MSWIQVGVDILLLVTGSGSTLVATRLFKGRDQRTVERTREIGEEHGKVAELMRQVAVLQAEAIPVNAFYQAMAIANLKHFHTPELDALLARVGPPSQLTHQETIRMRELLRETTSNEAVPRREQIFAEILPGISELVIIEQEEEAARIAIGGAKSSDIVKVVVPVLMSGEGACPLLGICPLVKQL